METLPVEIQIKILDEIPQFTRLNKTCVAGKNHLPKISEEKISGKEFCRYIEEYTPSRCYIFFDTDYDFVVVELQLQFDKYLSDEYHFRYDNNELSLLKYSTKSFTIDDLLKYFNSVKNGIIFYDIATTINIYEKLRKECHFYRTVLLDKFYDFTSGYHDLLEKYPAIDIPHASTIINNIKIHLYTICSSILINKDVNILHDRIGLLSFVLKQTRFDGDGYHKGDRIGILDSAAQFSVSYPKNLETITKFLSI